jgi:hypothetical protein
MLLACRLAGPAALEAHYAGIVIVTQSGLVDGGVAHGPPINRDGSGRTNRISPIGCLRGPECRQRAS